MSDTDSFKKMLRLMGISDDAKSDFDLDISISQPDWKQPILPEIEVSIDDIGTIFSEAGIFYQGRRVILYIRDQAQYFEQETNYKFHVTGCATLKGMYTQKRYDKYVLSENTSGIFKINVIIDNKIQSIEKKLHVCKHCLRALNWKGYKTVSPARQREIYEAFSLEEFFKVMNGDNQKNFAIIPKFTAETAPPNIYPANWTIISKMLRTEAGYTCSNCGKKISDTKNLHVHHRNGIKNDCSRSNLEVLCADCHRRKHNHKF